MAVIGTAGRKLDADRLTNYHWTAMQSAAEKVVELESVTHLVSGGAAWADHVAVELHSKLGLPLSLYLPAHTKDLEIAAYYHRKFSKKVGNDTWSEVLRLPYVKKGGFKDRNTLVATEADVFLAMTFGNKRAVADGGTKDTVMKMLSRPTPAIGYHLDLNTTKLYKITSH